MEYLLLRAIHVFFGILWAGGAITAGFFFIPSVIDAGPAGGAVMAGVMRRRMPIVLTAAGSLVVLTGIRLYMMRFSSEWMMTAGGLTLTLGAVLGLGAFVLGVFVQKPTAQRLAVLAAAVAASGAPPTPAQAQELAVLRAKLSKGGKLTAWHLIGAALLMSIHGVVAAIAAG